MSEETKQVLDMLAEGKITAEEAERLIEKLQPSAIPFGAHAQTGRRGRGRDRHQERGKRFHFHKEIRLGRKGDAGDDGSVIEVPPADEPRRPLKYLRVLVSSDDGDMVNVRVPLELVKTGIKLSTVLPGDTNAKLADKGIDLSNLGELQGEELVEALRDLQVDVDAADGSRVRIFCE